MVRSFSKTGALAALLMAGAAHAQDPVMRWTDAQGQVHYTNDASTIPADRRKAAVATDGGDLVVIQSTVQPGQAGSGSGTGGSAPAEEGEAAWRQRFSQAREKVATLEAAAQKDRQTLENPASANLAAFVNVRGTMLPNPELEMVRAHLANTEADLEKAKAAIVELDRKASQNAVPREWRR